MKIFPFLVACCFVACCQGDTAFLSSFANVVKYVTDGEVEFKLKFHNEPLLLKESRGDDEYYGHPSVSTTSGDVIGSTVSEAHAFFSVPYAAPPVGELRFRDTEPIVASEEPINATVPNRVTCRQMPHDECTAGYCIIDQREDCLVLNVFVPRSVDLTEKPQTSKLPIMLWIHGGAFFSGTGTSPKTDGRWLSNATETIVVTINYRLGAYGFLVYNKGNDTLNGNQGLKDQQMAMKWVQQNIANFGGDADSVTIFGESAGAQSVMWHMLSEVSRPLYRRAILESNAGVFPHQTPDEAMSVTNRLLKHLNCGGKEEFECLLNAPAEELDRYPIIMAASVADNDAWSAVEPYRPVVDGVEFTDQPLTLFQQGKWNRNREYIVGANTEEVEILQFYVPGNSGMTRPLFRQINRMFLGKEAGNKAADYYEDLVGPNGDDYSNILGVEAGDAFFICPSRAMSRFAYETADNPDGFYFYMFDHPLDGEYCHEVFPKDETCGYVYHSSEILFVFRSGPAFGYYFNDNDTLVSDQLSKYWGNFARNGNPNDDTGGPSWPEFGFWPPYVKTKYATPTSNGQFFNSRFPVFWPQRQVKEMTDPWSNIHIEPPNPYAESMYKEDICDFWDSLNFYVQFLPTEQTPTENPTSKTPSENPTSKIPTENPTSKIPTENPTTNTSDDETTVTGAALSAVPMTTTSGAQTVYFINITVIMFLSSVVAYARCD